ncbi:cytochrome P450 [Crossiella equi]|uniref:Cytochrome P450 n=1 Tax=Crossiella equi TaxID=130796 RepID=A0ABS5AMS2_9PSEU|nr:cytochrome P450 [Crossiella equi]MBP2477542.1 cytochrome P450 [Crossiella equi]
MPISQWDHLTGVHTHTVTSHNETTAWLADPRLRVPDEHYADRVRPDWRECPGAQALRYGLLHQDPPATGAARRLLSRFLGTDALRQSRTTVDGLAARYVDRLAGDCDAAELLLGLPEAVAGALTGVSVTDLRAISGWVDAVLRGTGAPDFGVFLARMVAGSRGGDGRDLVSFLARNWEPGRQVELGVFAFLLGADALTAAALLGSAVEVLTEHPDLLPTLAAPAAAAGFTREVLRLHPPVPHLVRYVAEPTATWAQDTLVLFDLRRIGRDPVAFARPDTVDPARFAHLGPGVLDRGLDTQHPAGGTAAVEITVAAVRALASRFERVEGTGPVRWRGNLALRTCTTLPVRATRREYAGRLTRPGLPADLEE